MTQQSSSSTSSTSTATRAVTKMIATSHDDSSDSADSAAATVLRWDEETTTVLRVKEEEVTEVAAGRMTSSSSSSSSSSRRKREYHEQEDKQQQQEELESHDDEEATTTTTKHAAASVDHMRACSSSSLSSLRFLQRGLVLVALVMAMAGCGTLTRSSFSSSLSVPEGSPPSEDHVSAWFLHHRLLQSSSSSSSSSSTMYNFNNNNHQDQPQQPQDRFYTNAAAADAEFGNHHDSSSSHHHSHTVFDSRHVHAPLFPLTASDYWGLGLAVVGLMIAAGGGIGGGGMLVPIYCLVLGFSPKHAIPLSNVTVLGGAVANTVLNSRKRHPADPKRPLIDWDLILVMEPLTIAGALLGAFLNKLLPELLLTVALVVLLAVTAQKSLTKAVRMYKAETKALQQQTGQRPDGTVESELTRLASSASSRPEDDEDEQDDKESKTADPATAGSQHGDVEQAKSSSAPDAAAASDTTTTKPPPSATATATADRNQSNNNNNSLADDHDNDDENDETELEEDVWLLQPHVLPLNEQQQEALLQHILQQEQQTFPATNLRILLLLFAVVLSLNLLKGGGAFPSPVGITCGSTAFWWANATILLWIVAVSWHCRNFLLLKYRQKAACGYEYLAGDMVWDERATVVYPAVCCLAGFFAGMFGIGGGIVKGPLMLAMGVHPAVSSASSACMILFTSFTATTSFVVFGLLEQWDYAVTCFTIGVTATAAGQLGLAYLMKRAQRNSYIAFSIGSVVLISAVLMTMQSLLSMAEGEPHNGSSGGGGICGTDDQYQHHHDHHAHDEHEQQLRQLLPWQPCGLLP